MKATLGVVLVGMVAWMAAYAALAEEPATALPTTVVAVSLFKNGLGFMAREAPLPRGDVTVLVDGLPAPVHGTLWVETRGDGGALKDLIAFERESVQQLPALTVAELLEANVGETVEARYGGTSVIRGKILAVPESRPAPPSTPAPRYALSPSMLPSGEAASLVLFDTPNGMVALNKNAIDQLSRVGGPLKTTVPRKKRATALHARATNASGAARLVIQYLARGISWAPSYVIDISEPKTARITAKAEIVNDLDDLDNVAVKFITGYPNIQFADVTDPMALREDLATFLASLANPPSAGQPGARRAVVMQNLGGSMAGQTMPGVPTNALEGQATEELFFYERKGVSLKNGERGYYPMFTAESPYDHVYQWKIGDTLDEQERQRAEDARDAERGEEIWHSVRLTNGGRVPWTTAPAMTVQAGQPLGQDVLYYTSAGGKTTVKITRAVDIKAERTELEVDRKRNAATFYGSSYTLLTVRGQLKVTNFKDRSVTLTITKDLSGEVVTSSPAAKVQQLAKGLKKANPHSQLTWELPINARGKADVDYTYRVYVRE